MGIFAEIGLAIWNAFTWVLKLIDDVTKYINDEVQKILDKIHFDTILKVHRIATIVSVDYRNFIGQMYGKLAEMSKALGVGAETLSLMTQSARVLILDTAALAGKPLHEGELDFLLVMGKQFEGIAKGAEFYARMPHALFDRFETRVYGPQLEKRSEIMGGFGRTINTALDYAESTVEKTDEIIDDLFELGQSIPGQIGDAIVDAVAPIKKKFTDFQTDVWEPFKAQSEGVLTQLGLDRDLVRKDTQNIIDRLKSPADYLLEIDKLEAPERLKEEWKIGALAARSYADETAANTVDINVVRQNLAVIAAIMATPGKPPAWYVGEEKGILISPVYTPGEATSWFRGDF